MRKIYKEISKAAIGLTAGAGLGVILCFGDYNYLEHRRDFNRILSQEGIDIIAEMPIEEWKVDTDNAIGLLKLLDEGKPEEAKKLLKEYLMEQAIVMADYKASPENEDDKKEGYLPIDYSVSKPTHTRMNKTIDDQLGKISAYLHNKNSFAPQTKYTPPRKKKTR